MKLSKAIDVQLLNDGGDEKVYGTEVDEDWRIGQVPHGGYVLGLIVSAVQKFNSNTPHPDPIHLTSHFLNSVSIFSGPIQIKVKKVKRGRMFANLDARLLQADKLCVLTHFICGTLPSLTTDVGSQSKLTIPQSSPLAHRIPISHPSTCIPRPTKRPYRFMKYHNTLYDPAIWASNRKKYEGAKELREAPIARNGMWATLLEEDEGEVVRERFIPFFADLFPNTPELLPQEGEQEMSWYPTVTMSIEFKFRFPSLSSSTATSPAFAPLTVGIYSEGRFMVEGRHDIFAEVWTAPAATDGDDEWKDKMVCLATSHQMALVVPFSVNRGKGQGQGKGDKGKL